MAGVVDTKENCNQNDEKRNTAGKIYITPQNQGQIGTAGVMHLCQRGKGA